MKERLRKYLPRILAFALVFGAALGVFSAIRSVNAEAASIHVSYKRYTRADIKFYYYPTNRALGGGLMYQDDGTPTYCIWWDGNTVKDSTLTVTDLEDVVTSEACLEGLYIIMQNGYAGGTDYTVGGINLASYGSSADEKEELAYYATSWAIHLWMAKYGYEKTTLVQNTANAMTWTASSLRAYGTNGKVSSSTMGAGSSNLSKAAWRAAMELLAMAVEGGDKTAAADITVSSQTIVGNYNVITLKITTANATGWTLAYSTLPSGSSVSKTSGTGSSDTVTVKIPISSSTATYNFTVTPKGIGRYVTDSYQYISGTGSMQSLVTWDADFTSTGEPGTVRVATTTAPTASLTLKKVDSSTGDARSGAVFTIQEQVTVNGTATWFDVGTLTEGSTAGTYDKISLTKYYDTSGTAHTYSTAKTTLVRTQYNSGTFRIKETTVPEGYTAQSSWQWCVKVQSAGSWSSTSFYSILGGSLSGNWVIGKVSENGAVWHYIKDGGTANYSNYATYNTSSSHNYDYGTSLGNTGDGIPVSLTKLDNDTGEVLTGAVFTISELVGGNWYEVGTLTDNDGDGVYTNISITCHYNSSGTKKTLSTAQTKLIYTDANTGRYRITEKTPPPGHTAQTGWAWYLKAVPESQWNSSASSPNSMYKSLYAGSYMEVGYPASSSKAVWTYVMFGHTAWYSTTATYDDSENAAYNLGTGLGNSGESVGISLNKVDNSTGDPVSGAVFTIYEQVNGEWYEVGTLTEGSTKGTYNVIEITTHYDSDGEENPLDAADYQDALVYTSANNGHYKVKETTAPDGYEAQPDWQWCIFVRPSSTWSSVSPNVVLGGSTSGTYIIGKSSASSTTAWHYIKAGNTAYYSHYATYDDTQNALFNYGTKLGNSPKGSDVSLTKVDYVTGTKLSGAVFSIEEKVNGTWYEVGTLTESESTSGNYNVIEITKHYNTNGKEVATAQTQTQLFYTEANGGEYRIKEKTPPDNYEASPDWCWYITVVPESQWPSGTDTTGLEGTLLSGSYAASSVGSTWKIMKVSDTKAVHYVTQGGTATYSWYAMFDVNTANRASNWNVYLGNTGITAGLSLNKVDYNSEEPLSGITFVIEEYVNGTWYEIGTLEESGDTAGTYDVVNITCHYNTNGGKNTKSYDVLSYTSANGGRYRVRETAVPDGYELAEDWVWYVQVVSDNTYAVAASYGDVLGENAAAGSKIVGVAGSVFAVYSGTDKSLTFYFRDTVPTVNSTYEGKAVTALYTGFDTAIYADAEDVPWYEYAATITSVTVADTGIVPAATAYWFYGMENCTEMDLTKLDTSQATDLKYMFYNCSSLTELDLSSFDVMAAMAKAKGLATSVAKNFPFSYMFFGCTSLVTIYTSSDWYGTMDGVDYAFAVFTNCKSLVGGNGKKYTDNSGTYPAYFFGYAVIDGNSSSGGYFTYRASKLTGSASSGSQGSGTAGTYAMVVHFVMSENTAYYSDYAEYDTTATSIAYNYEISDGEWVLANSLIEVELTLYKYGADNRELSGAEFTIQELIGSTWYNIGTLTSSNNDYVYDTVNITCHYDANGVKTELANAQAGLVLLSSNSGTYRVIETKAPAGYYCYTPDEWSWNLTVTGMMLQNRSESTSLTDEELKNYAVTVYKMWDDEDNYAGKRPNSVTVTLLQNGKAYGSSVTLSDSNGWSYSWTGLPTGYTYTVTETATADYTSTTTYTETSLQRVYTLTNTYEPKTTKVTAVKVWEDDDDTAGLRPTSIKVALYADGEKQGDSVTLSASSGWSYTWSGLKYYQKGSTSEKITYTVVEEEVTGYVQTKTSTTDSDGNLTITMTNTITKIPFLKVDTSGKAVAGATLRILDSNEDVVDEWTTDGSQHVVYGMKAGTYTLLEVSAPDGYLRAASVSFTVDENGKLSDGSTAITMTDENTSVNLLKTDAETGKALAGAKLSVTNAETGDEILSWISGDSSTKASSIAVSSTYPNVTAVAQSDGSILVTCLPTGEYILNETEAPDGYKTAANVTFTVTETSTIQSITIEDERYRELQILKTDADGNAISGATLALYKGSLTETDAEALVEMWVTDGTAHVLEDIEVGTYTLFELNVPDGYVTADPVTVTISQESGTVTAVMKDEPIVVTLLKTDQDTGEALAGATLKVTDAEGNTVVSFVSGSSSVKASSITIGDSYQKQITTDALSDGSLKITCLPAGDYTLTEVQTPDGYVTAESVAFTVEEKAETQSVTMEDAHTKVQISKTDLTTGKSIANAELTVTDESGNTVLTWTTGKVTNGTASITSVTAGSTYKDRIGTSAVVNEDGNWAIEIDYLPKGTYTLTETSVPDGYVKAEAVSFTVEETGEIQKAEMQDDVTKLTLYKIEAGTLASETDEDGNVTYTYTSVAGATLALTDSAGNLIVRFRSGDTVTKAEVTEIGDTYKNLVYAEVTADGGVTVYRLPAGITCTLTEETTPAGYITGTSVKFTTTESDDVAYVFMENDYTKLAVWKVDAETGEELPGALLQIIDENGDVVAEWYSGSEEFVLDTDGNEILVDSEGNVVTGLTQVTNADGTVTVYDGSGNVVTDVTRLTEFVTTGAPHEIDRLAAGTYTLHEAAAPEDYNVADDIQFKIAADGTVTSLTEGVTVTLTDGVYTITMEDQPGVPIYVSKVDENGDPLAGAVLAFYEGDVTEALLNGDEDTLKAALVERWTTDGTDHLIEHVKKGTYTLVEESAPDGYALTSAMIVTVDGSQNPYYITVVNTPEMDLPSTGGAGMVPVAAFAGIAACAIGAALLLRKRQHKVTLE
ncbi:MAG: Cna B-type domain-containing protein [Lachnospiraceae bacterium]|nr:Cna B-type domain-containing protein [Lachnospiraceae bacterium]